LIIAPFEATFSDMLTSPLKPQYKQNTPTSQ